MYLLEIDPVALGKLSGMLFFLALIVYAGFKIHNNAKARSTVWNCPNCNSGLPDLPKECSNCKTEMTYPYGAFDHLSYKCPSNECGKGFTGRPETCPYCNISLQWP